MIKYDLMLFSRLLTTVLIITMLLISIVLVLCVTQCCQFRDIKIQNNITRTHKTNKVLTGIYRTVNSTFLFKKSKIMHPCGTQNMCLCSETYALCMNHGRKLDYIPQLPKHIVMLNFTGNYLPQINSSTFDNLTDLKLTHLALKANSFESCGTESFSKLKHLTMLSIANENITSGNLKNCLNNVRGVNLKFLYLYSLKFTDGFQNDFFSEMETNHIIKVGLDGTEIKVYNQTTFTPLTNLKVLMLTGCGISDIYLDYAPNLRWLTLNNNRIHIFPNFCKGGKSLYPRLTSLSLQTNGIKYIPPSHISCLTELQNVTLTNNALQSIDGNTFSNLPKLHSLFIEYNSDPHMLVKAFAFNSSSLTNLYMSGNKFNLYKHQLHPDAFKECKNLRTLFLVGNNFQLVEYLDALLAPLTKLRKLNLAVTQLRFLPSIIPKNMKKLEVLYAHTNFITGWPDDYFHNLTSLKRLDLQQNLITVVNRTSFSNDNLESFELLGLGWNPYSCTCDLVWYIDYMRENNNSKIFEYYPFGYYCTTPLKWHLLKLSKVSLTQHLCFIKQISVNIISVTSTILVLVFCLSVVYRYRWHLRYFVYMLRFQQRRYQRHLQGPVYQYDLYLSCSENDFDFIYNEVVPRLEGELQQRLYIPQRDGVGSKIDGIISNMDVSRKAMLFVSDSYARDNYCEFEARLAIDKYVSERRNLMIVVVLEELNAVNVTKTLHKILNVDEYMKWGWDEESIRLFWIKLTDTVTNQHDMRS